jgi:O-antigen biosynthesis protein
MSVNLAIDHVRLHRTSANVEVWVVDNNSVDDSNTMVQERFPWVKLIANKENLGFSKANNQAMRMATGEYCLLLNPDTVVEESTFLKVVDFMDAHPKAGGLGVHMVDGNGVFLPESKRGLPTPAVSFYKIFGISRLFKKSARFNQYHLGHLASDAIHEVDILSGAFMLMRKSVLDEIGLLDEAFFMYGEDIDLSYRIIKAGYKNYYFPETTIIHYKGESTKKGSLNYVYVFYNAMVIFANKHFSQQNAKIFSWLINLAIWIRAGAAVLVRTIKGLAFPIWEIALVFAFWELARYAYAQAYDKIYQDQLVVPILLACCVFWSLSVFLGGGYDRPYRPSRVVRPLLYGAVCILGFYSLLPEDMRFSRALIVMGGVIAFLVYFGHRWLWQRIAKEGASDFLQTGILGSKEEIDRIQKMFISNADHESIIAIDPSCSLDRLREYIAIHKMGRLVFCARDLSSGQIIGMMTAVSDLQIEMKIAPPESLFMIGSNSIEKSGDIAIVDVNSITLPHNRRIKSLIDVLVALLFIVFWPLIFWIAKNPWGWFKNCWHVLIGRSTWVGPDVQLLATDKLAKDLNRRAIIHPSFVPAPHALSHDALVRMNTLYIKDYSPWRDLRLLWQCRAMLGNTKN